MSSYLKFVTVLLSMTLTFIGSYKAHATAPKQVCELYKELRLVSVGKAAERSRYEVQIDYLQLNFTDAKALESETIELNKVELSGKTFVASQKFEKVITSIQYERSLLGIRTTFYEIRGDKRRVLSKETDYAKGYQVGEARPMGPLVCFSYAE